MPNIDAVLSRMQRLYKNTDKATKIGVGNNLRTAQDKDFLVMPEWWKQATYTKGLPYGRIVMIAGDSDSGKTSCAIEAMKAAQSQDVGVLYIETEGKTTTEDLANWGVDPASIMMGQSAIAEEAYTMLFDWWDAYFEENPKSKLLVIFDSIGSVISKGDVALDLISGSQQPGGKGRINKLGLNKLIAKSYTNDVATLIINYTYDNIGSPGKTNAGGKAVNRNSALTYQTSRKGWIEKTVRGEKVRVGACVQWKLFKNHINKSNPGPKIVELNITADGIEVVA